MWRREVANFHCELAASALANSASAVRPHLMRRWQTGAVRASLLLGDLLVAEGRDEDALEAWKRIETQDRFYSPSWPSG